MGRFAPITVGITVIKIRKGLSKPNVRQRLVIGEVQRGQKFRVELLKGAPLRSEVATLALLAGDVHVGIVEEDLRSLPEDVRGHCER
jgi:hypothetical protein